MNTPLTPAGRAAGLALVLCAASIACVAPDPPVARASSGGRQDPGLAAAATADALAAVAAGEVRAELERYYADFSARDWEAFAGHFWPGATITTCWQPPGEGSPRVVVTSVPEFVAQAPAGPGSKAIFEERLTGAETRLEGGLAQVWARYEARFGDPGELREWSGVDAFTLVKHEGRWKIVALAFAAGE